MNRETNKGSSLKAKGPWIAVLLCAGSPVFTTDAVKHKYAENSGVGIHYAAMGQGPLVVFIHEFPDFWYSWHH